MTTWAGIPLVSGSADLLALGVRLAFDLISAGIVVRVVYCRFYQQPDYVFTYVVLNLVTFALGFLLSRVPLELGFALGLFAVFGILRYRTEAIEVRNLTYLFVVIGLALLNALTNQRISLLELLVVNGMVVGAVCLLENASFSAREESRRVVYDRLDLLRPHTADALLEDLRARTHLPVTRYEIGTVDLLRDTTDLTVYYRAERHRSKPSDEQRHETRDGPPSRRST
jgi:uncharacterized protein DUF4956